MVEFGAAAELSVELAPGEAAAVREELESELSDIGVGTAGAAGALGGGAGGAAAGSALTDGGLDEMVTLQQEQVDLTEDLLEEVEAGAIGGGGGDGPGFDPLSFLTGMFARGAGGAGLFSGLASRLSSSSVLRALATGGASVTGGVAAPFMTRGGFDFFLNQFSEVTGGPSADELRADIPGSENARAPLSPFNFLDAASTFFGQPDAPSVGELPPTARRNLIDTPQGGTGLSSSDISDLREGAKLYQQVFDQGVDEPPWLSDFTGAVDSTLPEPGWLPGFGNTVTQTLPKPGWLDPLNGILGTELIQPSWLGPLAGVLDTELAEPSWLDSLLSALEIDLPGGGGGGSDSSRAETISRFGEELGAGQRTSAAGSQATRQSPSDFGEELGSGQRTSGNRAQQERQQRRGDTTVDVTQNFELAQRELEQAMEQAKREAVREVERQVSQSGSRVTR